MYGANIAGEFNLTVDALPLEKSSLKTEGVRSVFR